DFPPLPAHGECSIGARLCGTRGEYRRDGSYGSRRAVPRILDVRTACRELSASRYRGALQPQFRGGLRRLRWRSPLGRLPTRCNRTAANSNATEPIRSAHVIMATLRGARALLERRL